MHHRKGLHAFNYGDFPMWDILLGTFRNPVAFHAECGFGNGADRKLLQMLAFVDVNAEACGGGSLGQRADAAPATRQGAVASMQDLQPWSGRARAPGPQRFW